MGIGGNFWDLLKPYARHEGIDFLRDKKVAVDLSFWIVQHETATKSRFSNPHIRITFFRTVNLFAKMGAYPVFVMDGEPSPLKSRARVERFCRANGIQLSSYCPSGGSKNLDESSVTPVKRNRIFTKCLAECVELLRHLGMPILKAEGEAEALCAQLNHEGHVDACITADSDALLYGSKCVIKSLESNSKEPFECYNMSDIEAGLGLKRKHLIAISLLVGNDHDLHGVSGIGVETAVRFVKLFHEDEVLNKLSEFGKSSSILPNNLKSSLELDTPTSNEGSAQKRSPHCSNCGHPGSTKIHFVVACDYCLAYGDEKCVSKATGFKCECPACDLDRRSKEQKKHEKWQISVCQKIYKQNNFPNREIIDMYLSNDNRIDIGAPLSWEKPQVDALVDFLAYYQHWEPSYTRQRILPVFSTALLREMALGSKEDLLLFGQYEFHSIHRMKIRYKCPYYIVKWKRATPNVPSSVEKKSYEQSEPTQEETIEVNEFEAPLDDELNISEVLIDEGCCFLLTDENIALVQAAFPVAVTSFLHEKEIKESKRRKSCAADKLVEPSKSTGVQLSITQFYRSSKNLSSANPEKDSPSFAQQESSEMGRNTSTTTQRDHSKSVKRRLFID